jgi:endonuclease YncB( thermonuclease family)
MIPRVSGRCIARRMCVGVGMLLLLVGWALAQAETVIGRVVGISDGDTLILWVDRRERLGIRLAGIDAPELDQPYGLEARRALVSLARDRTARVEVVDRDDYGRLIGTMRIGGRNVSAALVEQGAAWVYRRYNHDPQLPVLEAQAQAARRGLWGLPAWQRVPPWEWRRQDSPSATRPSTRPQANRPVALFRCGAKRTCREMASCEEAKFYLTVCGLKRLDGDGNGIPCETLCR